MAARAQLAYREGEMAAADALAAGALQHFEGLQWQGPWVHCMATRSIALRQLGRFDARAALLSHGLQLCTEQRRWAEASNLATALFDEALEAGDLLRAASLLAQIDAMAARDQGGEQGLAKAMPRLCRARLLAAQGHYEQACAGLHETLAQQRHRLVALDYAARLDELADWQLQSEQWQLALKTAQEAQQIQLAQLQLACKRNAEQMRETLAVEHAERERAATQTHASLMEARQAELEQSLLQQRLLHEELVEARKLAGLGQLLMGLSQALDQPLCVAISATMQAQQGTESLKASIAGGAAMGRKQLQDAAAVGAEHCLQAQAELERCVAEIQAYRRLRNES